ncbi:uncharacterized protein LOC101238445 isoform X3 [Hydra vulgaris]|uniref:Uncharacterized protein LOC101238445 isoform X3 n=1 Tax=Hydra vulgaris TaxID=6087 RepID=A0ABM4BFH6_HYDVU
MSQHDVIFQSTDDSSQIQYPSTETNYKSPEDHLDDNDEDDDDEVESLAKKNEPQKPVSAERLKAFNMFVRLFIDENLDRLVPISKQPKEKINAIIMSCQRQFPEFEDRARKRIRTYLKSCRRSIRLREDTSKPTLYQPATHPPEISHILAQACQNESHEAAKRQRLDIEKDGQKNGFLSNIYGKKDAMSPPFVSSSSNIELTHAEIISIKALIDGYRQSASFLHRSADELECILKNVHSPKVDSIKKEENRCPHGELLVSSVSISELKRKADQLGSLELNKQPFSSSSPTKALCNSSKSERISPSKFNFSEDLSSNKTIVDEEISHKKTDNTDSIEQVKSDISEKFNQKQSSSTLSRYLEPNHLEPNIESDESVEAQTDTTSKSSANEVYLVSESLNEEALSNNHLGVKQSSYQNNASEILYIPETSKSRVERNISKDKASQILTPIYSKRLQYTSVQHNRNFSPIPTTISLDNYERFETHQQRHSDMNSERIPHHSNMAQQLRNSTYGNIHSIHMSSSSQSPCSDDIPYDLHQKRITQENFYADTPSPKHSSANISLYAKTQLSPKLHSQFTGGNQRSQTVLYSPRQQSHQVRYHIGQQSRQNQLNNYTVFNFDSPSPQAYYENRHQHQQQNFHSVVSPHSYHPVISPNHSPLVQDLSKQTHFSDINRQSHYHDHSASSHGEYTHFDIHQMNK